MWKWWTSDLLSASYSAVRESEEKKIEKERVSHKDLVRRQQPPPARKETHLGTSN